MFKRILFFSYGSFSYLIFLGTFLYAIGFIGNFGVPKTLDGPASGPLALSLAIDVGLLTLFAVQHSVMRSICSFGPRVQRRLKVKRRQYARVTI